MKITLNYFRCHTNSVFEFEDNRIHLLKGDSGIGKSTVLWAIQWTLYGGLQHLANAQHPTKKTSVILEFPHVKITRSKRPDNLVVEHDTIHLEGQPAQDWIDQYFGNQEQWVASSYLQQSERHSLLTASLQSRLDLIQSFSFQEDDPGIYFERLDEQCSQIQSRFTALQTLYEQHLARFNEIPLPTHNRPVISLDEYNIFLKDLSLKREQLQDLISEMSKQQERIRNLEIWKRERQSSENQWSQILIPEDNIEVLKEDISFCENRLKYIPIQNLKSGLLQEISRTEKALTIINERLEQYQNVEAVSQDLYQQLSMKRQTRTQGMNICSRLNIAYTKEAIQTYIEMINRILEYQKWIPMRKARDELQNRIHAIPEKSMNIEELEEMKTRKTEWILSLEVKKCPHCQKGIRIHNGELTCYHQTVVTRESIQQLERQIVEWNREYEMQQQRQQMIHKLSAYSNLPEIPDNIPVLDASKQKEYTDMIRMLSSLQIVDETLDDLDTRREKGRMQEEKNRIELGMDKYRDQLKNIPDIPENLESESEYKRRIQEARNRIEKMDRITKMKEQLWNRITQYDSLINQIQLDETLEERCDILKKDIQLDEDYKFFLEKMYQYQTKQKELQQEKKELDQVHKELTSYQRLRQISKEVESEMLHDTVETINASLNEFADILFDAPLTFTLSTFKTAKSTNNTKPNVNLQIMYKNMENEWKQLSGGEIDRVSLCVLLAFARLSPSPIILLDECLVSLDSNLKSVAIELLRQHTNKTILVVLHDAVEGEFDNTVHF